MADDCNALTQKGYYYQSCEKTTESSSDSGFNESGDSAIDEEGCSQNSKLNMCLGYASAVLMALALATSAACSQALGGFVPAFELNCFRFGTLLLISAPAVFHQRQHIRVDKKQAVFLTIYTGLFAVKNLQYFEASIYLPAGLLGGLDVTFLIVLTSSIAIVLGEKCHIPIPVSVALSVGGIICLTQPSFLFGSLGYVTETHTSPLCVKPDIGIGDAPNSTAIASYTWNDSDAITGPHGRLTYTYGANITVKPNGSGWTLTDQHKGTLLVLGSAVGLVMCMTIQSRYLHDLKLVVIIFAISALGTAFSALMMLFKETPTFPTGSSCVLLLVGHSVTAAVGSCLGVVAVAFVPPVIFSLLASFRLLFFLIAQYTVLRSVNPGQRNWLEVVGAISVLTASVCGPFHTLHRHWEDRAAAKDTDSEFEVVDG